jgi:drug/metabolite transporter (DMT)-like permease
MAALAQLGFAAKAIFIKKAYLSQPGLDAVTLLALRMLLSLPLFILLAWWARRQTGNGDQRTSPAPLTRKDWWLTLWLGFIGYYLASFLDFMGLQFISAALERLILFLNPTIVVILAWAFQGKTITRRTVLALAISYAGLMLAYWHDVQIAQDLHALFLGSALVFASAVAYALYLLGGAEITRRVGSARFTAYMMFVATGFVLGQFAIMRPLASLLVPSSIWAYAVALAIFSTVLPVWMMAEALKRVGASKAAILGTVGPIFTILLGVIFLNEVISIPQLIGAGLTIFGVTLMSKKSI